jgi:Xaa-Pro aminopeptidase
MPRINVLKEVSLQQKLDGFLVFNASNILYFTGIPGTSALLVPRDGQSTIYVYNVNYEQAKTEGKNFRVELVKHDEKLSDKIVSQAQEYGIKNLAIDTMTAEGWRNLAKTAKGKTKLSIKGSLISSLRAIKDQSEIELLRKAADLTSEGMKKAYEVLAPGMKECEVAAEIEYIMRRLGSSGTAFETAVSSGPNSAFPHGGCSDRIINQGDLVVLDFGAVHKFYRSDITRTLVAGEPSDKQRKLHALVREAQDAAFKVIEPNIKAKDVDAAGRQLIEAAGYGNYFVHGLGHGVGLDIHESPILNPSSKEKLVAGNVVTNEPGIYLPGYGGVRIEDTILVLQDGAERLTRGPYGLGLE